MTKFLLGFNTSGFSITAILVHLGDNVFFSFNYTKYYHIPEEIIYIYRYVHINFIIILYIFF